MLVTNFSVKYLLYKVVNAFYQLSEVGRIHPMRERSVRALKNSVDYIEKVMPDALGFENQRELIEYSLSACKVEGHYLEFGVFTGGTIRFMAKRLKNQVFHGFDSFEGLPEDWGGFSLDRNAFNLHGRLPRVPANVKLHPGWFDDSLPRWLEANPGPVAFIHIDCDLYSSTKTILKLLADRLVPGTIILFDEYFNYPGWELHEYKALQEFVEASGVRYRYIAFARQQVAIAIESTRGAR